MHPFAAALTALGVGAAIALLLRIARGSGPARFGVAGAMVLVTGGAFWLTPHPMAMAPSPVLVLVTGRQEWVSSNACRSCHPGEWASWHDSYHRTMTQAASAKAVLAPLEEEVHLTLDGRPYAMSRQDDGVRAKVFEQGRAIDRRVVMTTGSHHYQAYWLEGDAAGDLQVFPFVFLLGDERRWIPRRDAFVEPPDAEAGAARWGSNCIQCHATAGRPAKDASGRRAEVAELGIACEACHGPGAAHVAKYQDPIARYAAHAKDEPDLTIANPSRLSADRASMICGACHAYTLPRDEEDFWAHGYTRSFRPGQDLAASHLLLTADRLRTNKPGSPTIDTDPDNLFYDDGTVRIGGREYNGMVLSACFTRGVGKRQLSCSSCHSMHDSDPDDQLTHGREGDGACATCHERAIYATAAHTHHAADSAGSSCVGCHMPKTAYALLKSIRSHRIDSPRANLVGTNDRPNACNLCHLNQSLAWTSSHLSDWYGEEPPRESPGLDRAASAGATWLLAGDPAERALAAAAMGDPPARRVSGEDWEAPLLALALEDPYAAVRFIAQRSLRQLEGYEALRFEKTDSDDGRHAATHRALEIWQKKLGQPFDPSGADALIAARSPRALTLSE
jgi:hypothetical protein